MEAEFIVGIGASAGGLEALERFFSAVQPDGKTAYILIQHLSPDFKSMMGEILEKLTSLRIRTAEQNMVVEPDTIYLNLPRTYLTVQNNRLHLVLNPEKAVLSPVNTLFESLGSAKGVNAVGVILSGTGRDGADGAYELAKNGGLIITQAAESALFDSMPEMAREKVPNSLQALPEEMPNIILEYVADPKLFWEEQQTFSRFDLIDGENAFSYLISLLQKKYSVDFSAYKPQTLVRRLDRRLSLDNVDAIEKYVRLAQQDESVLEKIYRDMLIDVTHFFRDTEAFGWLETNVIPQIVSQKEPGETVRLWIAACSTGEEAYSLAILFWEEIERQEAEVDLQVFATDLHPDSIVAASKGLYTTKSLEKVPLHRRQKYFDQVGDQYQIKKSLRQKVVFTVHNLLADPSFSRQDFISCRNMLIYIRPEMQKDILMTFATSLQVGGVLFLGPSEHLDSDSAAYFKILSRHWRVFQKTVSTKRAARRASQPQTILMPQHLKQKQTPHPTPVLLLQGWEINLLKALIPTGFIVDATAKLKEIYGDGHSYLSFSIGRVDLNLPELLPDNLAIAVRNGLSKATRTGEMVEISNIQYQTETEKKFLNLKVVPFADSDEEQPNDPPLYLIAFDERNSVPHIGPVDVDKIDPATFSEAQSLKLELAFTRETLQSTLEELESSNEELQSSNEELVAANEELQSSNEELSSLNEELYTVNSEYQTQNRLLNTLFNDTQNLMRAAETRIIFLDENLCLREITPACYATFGLIEGDIGRPLNQFRSIVGRDNQLVEQMALDALEGKQRELEIVSPAGAPLLLSTIPYVADQQHITGVILNFVDLTRLRELEADNRQMQDILNAMPVVATFIDAEMRYRFVNNLHREVSGANRQKVDPIGLHPSEVLSEEVYNELKPYYARALEGETVQFVNFESEGPGTKTFQNIMIPYQPRGAVEGFFVIAFEVTEWEQARQQAQQALGVSEAKYRSVVETQHDLICRWRVTDFVLTFTNLAYEKSVGYMDGASIGTSLLDTLDPAYLEALKAKVSHMIDTGESVTTEEVKQLPDGTLKYLSWQDTPIYDENGVVVEIQGIGRDMTAEREVQQALALSQSMYQSVVETQQELIFRWRPEDSIITFSNQAFQQLMSPEATESIVGHSIFDFHPPERKPIIAGRAKQVIESGEPLEFERKTIWADGRSRTIVFRSTPIFDPDGKVIEIQVVGRDITAEREAQQDLLMSQARYQSIVNTQREIILRYGADDFLITFANRAYENLVASNGFESVVGQSLFNFVSAERQFVIEARVKEIRQTGKSVVAEVKRNWKDGSVRTIIFTSSPIFDAGGNLVEIQAVGHDVTAERQIQQELALSRSRYQSIVDTQSELIIRWRPEDFTISYYNPAFEAFYIDSLGHGALPQKVTDNMTHAELKVLRSNLKQMLTTGEPRTNEETMRFKDGSERIYLWTDAPLSDVQGNIIEVQSVGRDVTAERRVQHALENVTEQLNLVNQNLPLSISMINQTHQCVYLNPPFAELFGRGEVGMHVAEILGQQIYETHQPLFEKAFAGEKGAFQMALQQGEQANQLSIQLIPNFEADDTIETVYVLILNLSDLNN